MAKEICTVLHREMGDSIMITVVRMVFPAAFTQFQSVCDRSKLLSVISGM